MLIARLLGAAAGGGRCPLARGEQQSDVQNIKLKHCLLSSHRARANDDLLRRRPTNAGTDLSDKFVNYLFLWDAYTVGFIVKLD